MQIRTDQLRERVRAARAGTPFDAREVLCAIARPRLSTTPGHEEVVAEVRWRFEQIGYDTVELPFRFAPWAGRFALTIGASTYMVGVVLAAVLLFWAQPAPAVVVLMLSGAGAIAVALSFTPVMHRAAWGQRRGINLLFRRPDRRPHYILMAHLDTKSQLVPLGLRAPAIAMAAASWLVLLAIAALSTIRPFGLVAVFVVGLLAVISGSLLALSWSGNDSPGALDNASGVATLLSVAEREFATGDVAFLVTDGEELGLAGARAAAVHLPRVNGVINIDGVDDEGRFFVLERFGWPRQGLSPHLAVALLGAAGALELPAVRRDVPLGLLLDHMPLVTAGIPALTVMRGELRSLARVHLPSDDLGHLRGTGIPLMADLLCAALDVLREQEAALV
jgi:hypothetical protein